ncbi:hypothetical protein BTA51_06960 [Hahella sp. CCB-MM4]|nr:hypothetical protein BTA51_06960 [Hahella sp. CCB-MM4]
MSYQTHECPGCPFRRTQRLCRYIPTQREDASLIFRISAAARYHIPFFYFMVRANCLKLFKENIYLFDLYDFIKQRL